MLQPQSDRALTGAGQSGKPKNLSRGLFGLAFDKYFFSVLDRVDDHLGNLWAHKPRGRGFPPLKRFPRVCTANMQLVLLRVLRCFRFVNVLFLALRIKHPVKSYRDDSQIRELVENFVTGLGVIKISDSGVIAAHDEMTAAEVLPANRREEGLPRPGIARIRREGPQNYAIFRVKFLHHLLISLDNIFGEKVPGFFLADHRVDK